jgi:ribosomal protein S1
MDNENKKDAVPNNDEVRKSTAKPTEEAAKADIEANPAPMKKRQLSKAKSTAPILTLEVGAEAETQKDRENTVWHEIKNSQITGSHLTGIFGKVEKSKKNGTISIIDYKGQRIAIPISEMMLNMVRPENQSEEEFNERAYRVLNRMMGAEIDFVVRGISENDGERVAVASRKAAMYRLRRRYYLNKGSNGKPQIYPGRIAEARIVAVSQLSLRVEVFGVETPIRNQDLSWGYVGDCRNEYFVGDSVQVRVTYVEGDSPETLFIRADIKSLTEDTTREKLLALKPQTNCIGRVTDSGGGIIFIRLLDGIRAMAHKCFDHRKPGKGDDVMFVVTRIDEDSEIAFGIIPRIVKRNL